MSTPLTHFDLAPVAAAHRLTLGAPACCLLLLFAGACREGPTDGGGSGGQAAGPNTASSSSSAAGMTTPLSVMNWNTRNFFNAMNDSPEPEEQFRTPAEYQAQLTGVATVLKKLSPDVAILAEVENESVLSDLNQAIGGNLYPHRSTLTSNDPRGADIAAVSKIPFDRVVTHKDDEFVLEGTAAPTYRFARDCVEYHLTVGGHQVVLLGVHFRSKGPPDDENKRIAEAQRVRAIARDLIAQDPQRFVAVLGDFNDLPTSNAFKVLAGNPPNVWLNAPNTLPIADQWTFDFMGMKELIDHQLSSPLLAPMLDTASVKIERTFGPETSDHAPLFAKYDLR